MIYTSSLDGITSDRLIGFFDGWPSPPDASTHLTLLKNSYKVVLSIDENTRQVVGFITALSDGVLSAYIPLLEVLPAYQNQGIGQELTYRMFQELQNLYMIDLICDENLQRYYERFEMKKAHGMILRNYDKQSGN